MAGIRGKNTCPELSLRRALHKRGLRYRLHAQGLRGKPDLVFARHRAVVFVHGCFWHRHPNCRFATIPATRTEFWSRKFNSNVARDKEVTKSLLDAGWRVAIVWECSLRGSQEVTSVSEAIRNWLNSEDHFIELGAG